MKWLAREEWRQAYNELMERHLGPPCEPGGIAFVELADKIEGEHAGILGTYRASSEISIARAALSRRSS